jgi:hypothetical protein
VGTVILIIVTVVHTQMPAIGFGGVLGTQVTLFTLDKVTLAPVVMI